MRADQAQDRKILGDKRKRELDSSLFEQVMAPLVLADTAKNSLLAKDVNTAEQIGKSIESYPRSVFENQVEGIDVINSRFPEFSKDYPSAAAAGGIALDVLDPISLAATTAKLPVTLARGTQAVGKKVAESMVDAWVKKNIKKKGMSNADEIAQLIKSEGFAGKLGSPDKLIPEVTQNREATGKQLRDLLGEASVRGAKPIDREKLKQRLITKAMAKNDMKSEAGIKNVEKLSDTLDDLLKPKTKELRTSPATLPSTETPPLPVMEYEKRITELSEELSSSKRKFSEIEKQKKARELAELKVQQETLEERLINDLTMGADAPPPIPRDVPVPPPLPQEAVVSRPLEDILKELSETRLSKANATKTNKDTFENLKKDVDKYLKAKTPREVEVPYKSPIDESWELKKSLRKKLKDAEQEAKLSGLTEKSREIREAVYALDDDISKSLQGINLPEGNAADLYKGLNYDYEMQSKFLDTLTDAQFKDWRSGTGGVIPPLVGGAVGAGTTMALGGNMPLAGMAAIAGAKAGQSFSSGKGIETLAKIGDTMSKPIPASIATQGAIEGLEELLPAPIEDVPSDQIDWDAMPIENPQSSVDPVEVPPYMIDWESGDVEQKMANTLNPQPMQFNPYVNEEILNTPLPRNTERLLSNPTVLKAKLSQAAPQHLPMLEDMLQNDQEGLRKAGPMIAQLVPSMFERDEYGAFDGKIVDPMMQQKFMVDLKRDEGLSSIEKAKLGMKLRRGEPI
jgi:hypothetical protein